MVTNDSDPDGNVPLRLVSVASANPSASKGSASLVSATHIGFEAAFEASAGTDTVIYVVSDSLGATATGVLTVTIRADNGCTVAPEKPPS